MSKKICRKVLTYNLHKYLSDCQGFVRTLLNFNTFLRKKLYVPIQNV